MKLLKQYSYHFVFLALVGILYLLFRLPNIMLLPIFTDEAIYMRWVQIASQDANWRFISLTDGKQPLFIWISVMMYRLVSDPLLAGRLVSVGAGLLTIIGLYILTLELFKKKSIAAVTAVLYVFYPMAHVHDRMALYDSLVTAFFVWSAYVSVLLVRHVRLDIAYTLGFVIGAGTLNKTSGFLSAYLLPFTLILFNFKQKMLQAKLVRWALYALLAFIISQAFYSVLRLSPYFHIIAEKDTTFVYPIREWLQHPFTFFPGNIRGLTTWLIEYMTVYLIPVVVSLILLQKDIREKAFLFVYFFLPFVALALFGKVLFPRYIFFMSAMLLPLAGWGIVWFSEILHKKYRLHELSAVVGLTVITLLYPAYVSVAFSTNPATAPIPKADSRQYANGWTSGWGVREASDFFAKEASNKKIYVATAGTFGLMPFALEMPLVADKNITVKGFWPIEKMPPAELMEAVATQPTYIVFYQPCVECGSQNEAPEEWQLEEVQRIKQGNADSYFIIYKVNAPTTQ